MYEAMYNKNPLIHAVYKVGGGVVTPVGSLVCGTPGINIDHMWNYYFHISFEETHSCWMTICVASMTSDKK